KSLRRTQGAATRMRTRSRRVLHPSEQSWLKSRHCAGGNTAWGYKSRHGAMRLGKGRDDFSAKEINRACGVVKAHIADHYLTEYVDDPGLFQQAGEIIPYLRRRTSNPMADALERREIARIDILQNKIRTRPAPEKFDGIAPARIGSGSDRTGRIICFGNHNVSGNANTGQAAAIASEFFPFVAIAITDRPRAGGRSKRHDVNAARCSPGNRIGVGRSVPDRWMRTLHGFGLNKIVFVVVEPTLEVENVGFECAHQHRERFLIHRRCLGGIDSKSLMLNERTATAHAHSQAPAAQVIEHADFLIEAQWVIERQYVD